jgi:hypothetical protein
LQILQTHRESERENEGWGWGGVETERQNGRDGAREDGREGMKEREMAKRGRERWR